MDGTLTASGSTFARSRLRGVAAYAAMLLGAAVLLFWSPVCLANPMALVSSVPRSNQVIKGNAATFALRFDGPIDHAGSRLTLVEPDTTRVLRPRLSSRPNTLFASAGDLRKGHYVLQWRIRGMDGRTAGGEIPFEVGGGE